MATTALEKEMIIRMKEIKREEKRLLDICDFKIADEVVWNADVRYCPIPHGNGVIVAIDVFEKKATILWRKGKFGIHGFHQLKKTGRNIPEMQTVLETIDSFE